MNKPKRVQKSPEQRKEEILVAAVKIFAERGYQVADTQAIADLAQVGKGTLYRYFPTKEELFRQALKSQMKVLIIRLKQALTQENHPLLRVRAVMLAYFKFFDDYPEITELFVQERAEFGRTSPSSYHESFREYGDVNTWVSIFENICYHYPVRNASVPMMMARYHELVHGALYSRDRHCDDLSAYHQVDDIFEFFLYGILDCPDPMVYLNNPVPK